MIYHFCCQAKSSTTLLQCNRPVLSNKRCKYHIERNKLVNNPIVYLNADEDAKYCIHRYKDQSFCNQRKKKDSEYCAIHSVTENDNEEEILIRHRRCIAKCDNGNQCDRCVYNASGFCTIHFKKENKILVEPPKRIIYINARDERKFCIATTKQGQLCQASVYGELRYCYLHQFNSSKEKRKYQGGGEGEGEKKIRIIQTH